MQDVASVRENLKRYCMCSGVAQDVWARSATRFQKLCIEQEDFMLLVYGLMPKLSLEELDLF